MKSASISRSCGIERVDLLYLAEGKIQVIVQEPNIRQYREFLPILAPPKFFLKGLQIERMDRQILEITLTPLALPSRQV